MRALPLSFCHAAGLAVLLSMAGSHTVVAASGKTNPPAKSTPSTKTNTLAQSSTNVAFNPAILEMPIPRSLFVIPKSAKEGRDPFFPNSTRLFGAETATKVSTNNPNAGLLLKALAGSAERRLATINNRTFEVGEEAEVQTGGGRVRVRCVEITDDSVVIEVGGARRTLRMRSNF